MNDKNILKQVNKNMIEFISLIQKHKMGFELRLSEEKWSEVQICFWYLGTDYSKGYIGGASISEGYWVALNRNLINALEFLKELE